MISEFTADEDWNVSGFEFFAADFNATNPNGVGISNYESTSWEIISGDDPYGVALFSGTNIADISDSGSFTDVSGNNVNVISFLVSDLAIELGSGTYFLAEHHDFSDESQFTGLETNTIETYYHTDRAGVEVEGKNTHVVKINGTVDGVVDVPEPALIAIFGLGLLGLGFSRKKKNI